MRNSKLRECQRSSKTYLLLSVLFIAFYCQVSWSAQEAIVVVEKAVIYSDKEMTSPIGFVRKGRKVVIGEIPRNKAQVYPIVVSGKLAYIKFADVSTEKEDLNTDKLVAERFKKASKYEAQTRLVVSYLTYRSQISTSENNDYIQDQDTVNWNGVATKVEVGYGSRWAVTANGNFLTTERDRESFRGIELGFGGTYKFIEVSRITARLFGELLFIPIMSYEYSSQFRKNSTGFTYGGGVTVSIDLTSKWGIELMAGLYKTQLHSYNAPEPYADLNPSFIGARFALGLEYLY